MIDILKKTAKHSIIYGSGNIFVMLIGFILMPLYTRFLSPEEYGVYSIVWIMGSILALLYDMGMITGMLRWYYEYPNSEQKKRRVVLSTSAVFITLASCVFTAVFIMFSKQISCLLFKTDQYFRLVNFMVLATFFNSAAGVPLNVFRVKEQPSKFVFVSILRVAVLILFTVFYLVISRQGLEGVFKSFFVSSVFITAVLFFLTWKDFEKAFSWNDLSGMLRVGLPYFPVLFFSWIIDFSDRYILGQMATLSDVGLYSIGYKIGQIVYIPTRAFLFAWPPILFSIARNKDAPKIFSKLFNYYTACIFFIALSVSLFGIDVIKIFTTPVYYEASKVIPYIAFSYLLYGAYGYMLFALILKKDMLVQPLFLALAAVLNVILNILLIPLYGMTGAAMATLFAYAFVAFATYIKAQRCYRVNYEFDKLSKILGSAFILFFLGFFVFGKEGPLFFVARLVLIISYPFVLYLLDCFDIEVVTELKKLLLLKNKEN